MNNISLALVCRESKYREREMPAEGPTIGINLQFIPLMIEILKSEENGKTKLLKSQNPRVLYFFVRLFCI